MANSGIEIDESWICSPQSCDRIDYSRTGHRRITHPRPENDWLRGMKDAIGTHQFVSGEESGELNFYYPMDTVCRVCKCWLSSDGVIFKRGTWEVAPKKCHLMVLI
jgi:hypothetical protein